MPLGGISISKSEVSEVRKSHEAESLSKTKREFRKMIAKGTKSENLPQPDS